MKSNTKKIKAVGLMSGGMDSIIAAKIIKDLGIEVFAIHFSMPWGCGDKPRAIRSAAEIDVPLKIIELDDNFLEIIKKPSHGVGTAINPCTDCKIYFLKIAKEYMKEIDADFIFTGEVLGQRPMSQVKYRLDLIEKQTELKGYLLRPLSAQLLQPTILEEKGLVDRSKLLSISGRSRKEQIKLATKLNLTEFNQPAGGCLLTDRNFARRLEDAIQYGYGSFKETTILKWGRHFRINKDFKSIIGRNEKENSKLVEHASTHDYIMELKEDVGPTLILKGLNPSENILSICGGIIQRFSKFKDEPSRKFTYYKKEDEKNIMEVEATILSNKQLNQMQL
ncbi:MAG: tRNA 4-thiouridine(8) synthase ThiI [Candidatus Zapsychrus exili]|nr:tRNA 4-thiouridine(8) synthase ThiI [Candidatus Zapsychrus exili]